jgi:selenocysteine-specific elongation factor
MIIATAGHIDHGKTLLVKKLTGVDTDRLPEEKARGISIDLGFAYLPGPDGNLIGFVDVPGHERFVRNMLAGVCGIDLALLIVAADDGVMPQTVEHLQILDLLGVNHGMVVITKIDRVPGDRVGEVGESVKQLLAGTSLESSPIFPVSAINGEGIESLREAIFAESKKFGARKTQGRRFRFAVDRVFSITGSGTVVTGTVFSGMAKTGDQMLASPANRQVRIRSIQVGKRSADSVSAGQRCALNLTGPEFDRESIARGHWVLDAHLHRPTNRIDVKVKALALDGNVLKHWMPVYLHLGTEAVTARIAIRRGESVRGGDTGIVQLVLDQPIGALHGDRFVLRDQSASRTLAGGVVIDPFAPARNRHTPQRRAILAALEKTTPDAALRDCIAASPDGLDLDTFEKSFNLDANAAAQLYRSQNLVQLGKTTRIAISAERRKEIREQMLNLIRSEHAENPKSLGIERAFIARRLKSRMADTALGQLVDELAGEGKLQIEGARVRQPGHDATSNPADDKLWQRLLPLLQKDSPLPPGIREIVAELKLQDKPVRDLLHRKSRTGDPVKVTDDRFFLKSTVLKLAALVEETAAAGETGKFTAAEFRNRSGAGRNHSIEVLEYFDRIGFTQRLGDTRKIRRSIEQALAAQPGGGPRK